MKVIIGKNAGLSLNRPAWIQSDINAYKHLHIRGQVIKDYFNKRTRNI